MREVPIDASVSQNAAHEIVDDGLNGRHTAEPLIQACRLIVIRRGEARHRKGCDSSGQDGDCQCSHVESSFYLGY
jgi:hypothetical protein